jgi:transcriptional regulator with XRE-family HTH domain
MKQNILLSGECGKYLKQLRVAHDRTVQSVAEQAGLSKSFISMVESGARSLKFQDLRRILVCYEYSVAWFVTQIADEVDFMQAGERRQVYDPHSPHNTVQPHSQGMVMLGGNNDTPTLRLLRLLRHRDDAEFLEIALPPRTQLSDAPMSIEAEIRGVVRHGTLLLLLKGDEHIARAGDEFCFDGSQPHIFRNYTTEQTAATLVIMPPAL